MKSLVINVLGFCFFFPPRQQAMNILWYLFKFFYGLLAFCYANLGFTFLFHFFMMF